MELRAYSLLLQVSPEERILYLFQVIHRLEHVRCNIQQVLQDKNGRYLKIMFCTVAHSQILFSFWRLWWRPVCVKHLFQHLTDFQSGWSDRPSRCCVADNLFLRILLSHPHLDARTPAVQPVWCDIKLNSLMTLYLLLFLKARRRIIGCRLGEAFCRGKGTAEAALSS